MNMGRNGSKKGYELQVLMLGGGGDEGVGGGEGGGGGNKGME